MSDDGSASEGGNWEEWNESDAGGDGEPARSLFSATMLSSPEEAFAHDAQQHGFDIRQYAVQVRSPLGRRTRAAPLACKPWRHAQPVPQPCFNHQHPQEKLDEYDIFRCINFIRRSVAEGTDPLPSLAAGSSSSVWRGNDDYLKPVMEDDALLFFDYDDIIASWRCDNCWGIPAVLSTVLCGCLISTGLLLFLCGFRSSHAPEGSTGSGASTAAAQDELQRLREENEGLREALAMLAASCMPDDIREGE